MPLRGAGGEPVDFARTLRSHGCARLPPAQIDPENRWLRLTVRSGAGTRAIVFCQKKGQLVADAGGANVERLARRVFRLDENLAPFYGAAANDPQLAWVASGAGRMLASASVFEEIVKTIFTTNCAWSGTVRMVSALVEDLGRGAFPTPHAVADAPAAFFRDRMRAGYRGEYLRRFARSVASGEFDPESLLPRGGLSDDEVEARLRSIPGCGAYAAAHVMMLLGRYRRLILDSWTRPAYLRVSGKRRAADRSIERAFRGYGAFAGLAFWLTLTKDWVAD